MTGYTVHTGSTVQFSESWDRIFQQAPASKTPALKKAAKKFVAKQQSPKKGAAKAKRK